MGFLSEGDTLTWEEASTIADKIRKAGLEQLLHIYENLKTRNGDQFTWGDEIEYLLVHHDPQSQSTKLSLRAAAVLPELMKDEQENPIPQTCWRPEFGAFMLESTPGTPYTSKPVDLLRVQASMELRRAIAQQSLKDGDRLLSMTVYPLMGVGNFTDPAAAQDWVPGSSKYSKSLFIQDEITNPHPRFGTLAANIRTRRGKTVDINVPLFHDQNTKPVQYGPDYLADPSTNPAVLEPPAGALPDHIYMDAMAFGMGCCCLQCTFQCCNLDEARLFYDQLSTLSPIMMALTASAPIFRGYLADTDVRWYVISAAVDDRCPEERGLAELSTKKYQIPKSRYDSISLYISKEIPEGFNDLPNVPINQEAYDQLIAGGVDPILARHFAHLFIRDPLVIYKDRIDIDPKLNTDHFENIQSTNWQTVRFKPPPPQSSIGWRVEFRSMEVQFTDFENAAFAVFIVLVTRAISSFSANLYLPLSKTDENMKRAHARDAARAQKFFFRNSYSADSDGSYSEMTINEIINGKAGGFQGMVPLVQLYLETITMEASTLKTLQKYLTFISKRASGEYITPATWIRNFVTSHPDYKHDSVVSHKINHDLLNAVFEIGSGQREVPELLPPLAERKLSE